MSDFVKAMLVMDELFMRDCLFALATAHENRPSVRTVDTYYEDGAFYVVTYAGSAKVKEIEKNEYFSLCGQAYKFSGSAHNIGHPLIPENAGIREKLIKVFEPWYFKHNNENDAGMCYLKLEPCTGFFYKDGNGYSVDFKNRTVEMFPFTLDIVLP